MTRKSSQGRSRCQDLALSEHYYCYSHESNHYRDQQCRQNETQNHSYFVLIGDNARNHAVVVVERSRGEALLIARNHTLP